MVFESGSSVGEVSGGVPETPTLNDESMIGISPTTVTQIESMKASGKTLRLGNKPVWMTGGSASSSSSPVALSNSSVTFSPFTASSSGGLDALAAAASSISEAVVARPHSVSASSEEDSEAMPPPPPRHHQQHHLQRRRLRASSNPEGMEKWDTLGSFLARHRRSTFILPDRILEEELAEAKIAVDHHNKELQQQQELQHQQEQQERYQEQYQEEQGQQLQQQQQEAYFIQSESPTSTPFEDNATNENPDAMLRRARARILEDLSVGANREKGGVVTLPHSLDKYREIYNKHGRVGIYAPSERAAIIARFHSKRERRIWNKKIRYSCRKNLADRRLRVKGRFVKKVPQSSTSASTAAAAAAAFSPSSGPDVHDPEAGFCPTEDQPFRRLRRHTIT